MTGRERIIQRLSFLPSPGESKCSRCGIILEKISYIEPDWRGERYGVSPRPPLCKSCWKIADKEASHQEEEINKD